LYQSKKGKYDDNKTDTIVYPMLILISCLLLFATALALMIMRVNQSGARYAWLIAVTGAMLAFVSVWIWLAQMPFDLVLPA